MNPIIESFNALIRNELPQGAMKVAACRQWKQMLADPRAGNCDMGLLAENFVHHVHESGKFDQASLGRMFDNSRPSARMEIGFAQTHPRTWMPEAVFDGDHRIRQAKPLVSEPSRSSHAASGEQKLWAALGLISAAMSAASAYSSFKRSVVTDEQGKNHVAWSQVGLGMLSAAFAIGLSVASVQYLQASPVR